MRTAALVAGVVQILCALFIAAPQWFGTTIYSTQSQTAFRLLMVVGCLILAAFSFAVVGVPTASLSKPVGITSVVAAAALTLENLGPWYETARETVAASEIPLWKYHPVRQFTHVFGLTIPALVGITLAAFLVTVFVRSQRTEQKADASHRRSLLWFLSYATAAVFDVILVWTFLSVPISSLRSTSLVLRLSIRCATLVTCAVFFVVFGRNQRQRAV